MSSAACRPTSRCGVAPERAADSTRLDTAGCRSGWSRSTDRSSRRGSAPPCPAASGRAAGPRDPAGQWPPAVHSRRWSDAKIGGVIGRRRDRVRGSRAGARGRRRGSRQARGGLGALRRWRPATLRCGCAGGRPAGCSERQQRPRRRSARRWWPSCAPRVSRAVPLAAESSTSTRAARPAGSARGRERLPFACSTSDPRLRISATWLRVKRTSVLEASRFGSVNPTVTSVAALKRWVRAPAAAGRARSATAVRMAVAFR